TRKHYSQLPEKPHGCVEARVGGDTGRSRCGAERVSVVTCQGVDGNSHADHQRRVPGRITTVGVDVHRVGVAYPEPLAGDDRDGALLVADHVLLVEKPPGDLPVRETLHLDVEFVADRVEQSFAYGRPRRAVPFHPHPVTSLEHLFADHHEQCAPGVRAFEGGANPQGFAVDPGHLGALLVGHPEVVTDVEHTFTYEELHVAKLPVVEEPSAERCGDPSRVGRGRNCGTDNFGATISPRSTVRP